MSYCRFSSMDYSCDIYCYESCHGGFEIILAGRRVLGDIPKAEHLFRMDDLKEYLKAHQKQMKFLKTAKYELIGLEFDGESFNEPTALDAANKLKELKEIGYNVPDYAIKALIEESELIK